MRDMLNPFKECHAEARRLELQDKLFESQSTQGFFSPDAYF